MGSPAAAGYPGSPGNQFQQQTHPQQIVEGETQGPPNSYAAVQHFLQGGAAHGPMTGTGAAYGLPGPVGVAGQFQGQQQQQQQQVPQQQQQQQLQTVGPTIQICAPGVVQIPARPVSTGLIPSSSGLPNPNSPGMAGSTVPWNPTAAGPYGGVDAYNSGRMSTSLPPDYKRSGDEVYWNMRRSSLNVKHWIEHYYKGNKSGEEYQYLWLLANNIDAELEKAYQLRGMPGVEATLAENDVVETALNTIAVNHAVAITGDHRMGAALKAVQPPGQAQVLPNWVLDEGRSESQQLYKQENRKGPNSNSARQRRGQQFANAKPAARGRGKGRGRGAAQWGVVEEEG
jgi:hypothetical protein